jgi:hypothetical protein
MSKKETRTEDTEELSQAQILGRLETIADLVRGLSPDTGHYILMFATDEEPPGYVACFSSLGPAAIAVVFSGFRASVARQKVAAQEAT